jgi:hypothetical protein
MKGIKDYLKQDGFIDKRWYDPVVKAKEFKKDFDIINKSQSVNMNSLYYSKRLDLYALVDDNISTKRYYVKEMFEY